MSVKLNRDGAIKIIESIQKDFEERRVGMVGIYAEAFNTYIAALEMAKKSLEVDEKYDLAYEDAITRAIQGDKMKLLIDLPKRIYNDTKKVC